MKRAFDVIGVCTAAAILIAGSAPALAGGFSRHHGHHFGHGGHLSLHGHGAGAAVILGLGLLTLLLIQRPARYDDPYRYRYRYPYRYQRSYVRPGRTIYAPQPPRIARPRINCPATSGSARATRTPPRPGRPLGDHHFDPGHNRKIICPSQVELMGRECREGAFDFGRVIA